MCRCLVWAMALAGGGVPHSALQAGDWPQFLGPTRNGVSEEQGLLDRFPEGGPPEAWRIPGGGGMSGLAIADGVLYTLVQGDGQQWALAVDALTGAPKWRTPLAPAYENAMGNGPRATPCVHDGMLFTYTGEGILTALRAADGKVLWSRHPVTEFDGRPADYGMASSPLVHAGLVIVTVAAPRATVAAYDARSGVPRWQAGTGAAAGYSSPTVLTLGGEPRIVAFTGDSVIGLELREGRLLWQHRWETDYHCNIAVPLEVDGQVLISSGENHGSALLQITDDGQVRTTWSSTGPDSLLRNEWQTSLIVEGALYGFDNVGSAGPVTHFTCIDPRTATRRWQQKRFGKGNAIAADGKLWISTMNGELVLLRANPDAYEELGRATVLGSTRQAPSLANGRLYLRDDQEIVALDVARP